MRYKWYEVVLRTSKFALLV